MDLAGFYFLPGWTAGQGWDACWGWDAGGGMRAGGRCVARRVVARRVVAQFGLRRELWRSPKLWMVWKRGGFLRCCVTAGEEWMAEGSWW